MRHTRLICGVIAATSIAALGVSLAAGKTAASKTSKAPAAKPAAKKTVFAKPSLAPFVPTAAAKPVAKTINTTVKLVPVGGEGWAQSSINGAVFRTSSIVTFGDTQYVAYYDGDSNVVLGKRKLGSDEWETTVTPYKGRVNDAHNVISLGVDGKGILHMVWDLHDRPLRYARSVEPGSLELTEPLTMLPNQGTRITYPQFYPLPNGDLLFFYRDGASGNGNTMLNRYDVATGSWAPVQQPLIDGQNRRNAYINRLAVDSKGGLHLSWCWRDSPNVASNHDICYAYSPDQGKTWQKSTGEKYSLPITADSAEIAWAVPQNSELINQTTATVDTNDRPVICTYWRSQDSDIPQFRIVWHDGKTWRQSQVGNRTQPFRLAGGGTKRIPISRPVVLAGPGNAIYVIFRDEERGNGITAAVSTDDDHAKWQMIDLDKTPLGAWEPTYDSVLWANKHELNLFVQNMGQGDGEKLEQMPPQPVSVLQWTP